MDFPPLKYSPPSWEALPDAEYVLETFKNGIVIERTRLNDTKGSYVLIGRLPDCNVSLEHSSVSRYHAVIQFGSKGVFLFDLGSTHGTFLNKKCLESQTYVPIPCDNIFKFGESTRSFSLIMPHDKIGDLDESYRLLVENWAKKKSSEIDFKLSHSENGYECKVDIEASKFDIKSDIHVECIASDSTEAICLASSQIIDSLRGQGEFIESLQEIPAVFISDLDDSDEFYDRARKKQKKGGQKQVETYESLIDKQSEITDKITRMKSQLEALQIGKEISKDEDDEMDAYMNDLLNNESKIAKEKYMTIISELEAELEKVQRLIKVAKPI